MSVKTKLRQRVNKHIKDRMGSGSSSTSTVTDGSTGQNPNQQAISPKESTYPCCDLLPLRMFERYSLYNDLQGMSAEHWEQLYSEYNELTGDASVKSTIVSIGTYNALSLKLTRITTILNSIGICYDNNAENEVDIDVLIKAAQAEFKQLPMKFSRESYVKDIELCGNFLKTTVLQYESLGKQLEDQMKNKETDNKNTFFDDILFAYSEYNKTPLPDKDKTSTQQFALIIKKLNNASRPD